MYQSMHDTPGKIGMNREVVWSHAQPYHPVRRSILRFPKIATSCPCNCQLFDMKNVE